jgi:hypothetical protein
LWLAIFAVCAVVIAKRQRARPFLHGVCIGLLNSAWITSAHVLLFDAYISHHPEEAAMMSNAAASGIPVPPPRLMMMITGPVIGLVSGVVLGLFALVACRAIKPPAA